MKNEEAKDLAKRFHRLSRSKTDWVKEHSDSMVESDGRAHVKVDLRKTTALNLYSGGTRIHPDILEFIEDEAIYTEVEKPLSIDFYVEEKDAKFDKLLAKEVKNHYLFKFSETKKQKSDVVKKSWNLLLAGIFFVIVYILMSYFSKNSDNMSRNASLWLSIFSEVIDIVYWVFIWEAVDKFFFEQREVQRQLLRLTQLATADINFIAKGKWEEEKKKFHSIEEDNKEEAEID